MKRLFFLAALCLLSTSAYAVMPWVWNYGDPVYGHEANWNFDEVELRLASSTANVSTLTARVAACEVNISSLQAADATHTADILANTAAIATHTGQIASLSVNDGTIEKLTIAYQAASQSLPFSWTTTGLGHYALSDGDVIRFRFDYVCYAGVSYDKKYGTIDGCIGYNVASGTSFVTASSSLMTLDHYTAGASDWSVVASYSDQKLKFIASFPVSVRAYGTCFITGK